MKISHLLTLSILVGASLFIWKPVSAERTVISDWYIKDFETTIDLHPNSTATITEHIIANAGTLPDKHGIFRILPTQMNIEGTIVQTPIKLHTITDFSEHTHPYSTIKNPGTITWKIGSPDKTVQGENKYRIHYTVGNVIRTDSDTFDEFFWNLNGNFWDIETDAFTATINFPSGFKNEGSEVNLYSGQYGDNMNSLANFRWIDTDTLEVTATRPLTVREGITVSVTMPKGIVTPYQFTWWQLYGQYLWLLLPLLSIIICLVIWKRYGDDPNLRKPIIPEYEPPEQLPPLELGMIMENGKLHHRFVTATIIDLARRGIITITEQKKKGSYTFTRTENVSQKNTTSAETTLIEKLFGNKATVSISGSSTKLTSTVSAIQTQVKKELKQKNIFEASGFRWQIISAVIAVFLFFITIFSTVFFGDDQPFLIIGSGFVSALIFLVISIIMPKKTLYGAELEWKGKGFKMFMNTAEKHRQIFFEKEGLFEELLPYAIMFDMTKKWIKAMKQIYGKEFIQNYHPVWFTGVPGREFSLDTFSSSISSLSSSISSSVSPKSGSGGGGFSGGGGGGGGGGGW